MEEQTWTPISIITEDQIIKEIERDNGKILYSISGKGVPPHIGKRYFERQEEDEYFDHIYIWQTVGFMGDDYSGYQLIPVYKGKYLLVSYEC